VPPNASIAILAIVKRLMTVYPKTQLLLENDTKGSGIYAPELDDPDHCNAFATTAWELALLQRSPQPMLSSFAKLIASSTEIKNSHTPSKLLSFYAPNKGPLSVPGKGVSFLYPEPPRPAPHPLQQKIDKYQKQLKANPKMPVKAWTIETPLDGTVFEFAKSLTPQQVSAKEFSQFLKESFPQKS